MAQNNNIIFKQFQIVAFSMYFLSKYRKKYCSSDPPAEHRLLLKKEVNIIKPSY